MKCGLLGQTLSHSYSPQIHALLGNEGYSLFEVPPEKLGDFLQKRDFTGLNVTVPYKKAVIPYLDDLTSRAKELGAVNTIVRRDGKLIGHNTDYFGFSQMVKASGFSAAGKKVLVLGSGGASNTAVAVLQNLGAQVVVISRSGPNHYGNLARHADAALLVNTTPVGMYPHTGISPVHLEQFPHLEGVLDVIYNPARTKLLLDAERRGLIAENGLLMLVAQAKESAQWFLESDISDSVIEKIHRILEQQMHNIILIGMPGCGKSTIGTMLAQRLGKTFVDADAELIAADGRSIPDIFADCGESGFRELETATLSKLGKQSGLVIATGGGCITREENYPLLHQNGSIFYLMRNLDKLPTDGRPLSQSHPLEQLFRQRAAHYEAFADYRIDNNGTPEEAIAKILEVLQ